MTGKRWLSVDGDQSVNLYAQDHTGGGADVLDLHAGAHQHRPHVVEHWSLAVRVRDRRERDLPDHVAQEGHRQHAAGHLY